MKKFVNNIQKILCRTAVAALFVFCLGGVLTAHAEPKAYDLIVPDADTRYYTDEDIRDMPLQVVCYGKNEIYARHGRMFVSRELDEYFRLQPWYSGTVKPESFSPSVFNVYEQANVSLLSEREKALSQNGYVLDQPGYSFDAVTDYIAVRSGTAQSTAGGIGANAVCDNHNQIFSTEWFSFDIPDAWMPGFVYELNEDSINFCCGLVWNNGKMKGTICTILRSEEWHPADYYPAADYLGDGLGYSYYLLYPTDVQYDPSNSAELQSYLSMSLAVPEVKDSFRIY